VTAQTVADALVDALAALTKAESAVTQALAALGADTHAPIASVSVAVRTTSTQVLSVLAQASGPLTLYDVADGVLAIRRGEDTPKRGGGTRYGEMCRTALARLIERGMVVRVEPAECSGRMRYALALRAP